MVFSLFPRKSASALLFRETVQTQYLNKIRGAQKSVIPSKHFSIVRFRLAASRRSFFSPKLLCQFVVGRRRLCRHRFASKIPSNAQTPRKIRVTETAQKVHGRAREVRHADRTRTDVRGPKHPGLVGAGCQKPLCRGRLLLLCVCVCGAELAVGRVRRTWGRGALRGVGQTARGRWVLHPRGWSPRVGGGPVA